MARQSRRGFCWTAEKIEQLIRLHKVRASVTVMMEAVGATRYSISKMLCSLNSKGKLPDAEPVEFKGTKPWDIAKMDQSSVDKRKCLGCQRMFTSTWIGNRMCKRCASLRYGIDVRKTR